MVLGLKGWKNTSVAAIVFGIASIMWCGRRSTGTRFLRGMWVNLPLAASRNRAQPGDGDLRRIDQSGPCSQADSNPAAHIGVAGCAIPERQEFAQAVERISGAAEAVLGPAPVCAGYWVATSGNVTDEMWKRYIEEQSLRSQTTTLMWCNRPHGRSIRLPALTRSHHPLGGGEFTTLRQRSKIYWGIVRFSGPKSRRSEGSPMVFGFQVPRTQSTHKYMHLPHHG